VLPLPPTYDLGRQLVFSWGSAFWSRCDALGVGIRAAGLPSLAVLCSMQPGPQRRVWQLSIREVSLPSPQYLSTFERKTFFLLVVLGFELRASQLLIRYLTI
jgi:hypothetical protein